ncbi:hypothetical protein A2U01_0060893, partial [Trifolium medium]|nr:hypothetical protein [Trifolium medium]
MRWRGEGMNKFNRLKEAKVEKWEESGTHVARAERLPPASAPHLLKRE